ncbi:hypothetical protein Taro_034729 [Colocasia esculenta]|uniref:Uncharacterized protein n=1 Tax=Colocasia esculenta TaxID=4460 RepID=A0A843WGD8_COLES|nr:hypothetical protein [Colocasia esculenta]
MRALVARSASSELTGYRPSWGARVRKLTPVEQLPLIFYGGRLCGASRPARKLLYHWPPRFTSDHECGPRMPHHSVVRSRPVVGAHHDLVRAADRRIA